MKERVLYVISSFGTGGICRALQNTLNCFDINKYEVDVFAIIPEGVYSGEFANCNVLESNYLLSSICPNYYTLHGFKKVVGYTAKIVNRLSGGRFITFVMKRIANRIVKKRRYQAVIAYSEGLPTKFVSEVSHPNKIAWIHCDYQNYLKIVGQKEYSIYQRFNHIVCVSEYTRKSFLNIYPEFTSNTQYIYNVIDSQFIKKSSRQEYVVQYETDLINVVSVGRIDPVKRFSEIPKIISQMKNSNNVKWYIVGPAVGNQEEYKSLKNNIEKYEVQSQVILLGEMSNPYPYIANADILACTSVSEACPYVINEAKILGTPIVSTNFGSAYEFIEDDKDGIIAPIEKMANAMDKLIDDHELYSRIKKTLGAFEYDNVKIMSAIYSLISK